MSKRQTVSLCMMVRDEAAFLAQALEAARPLCDEFLCAVDDTSKDDTELIARRYLKTVPSGKVWRFTWPDHFANARNAVMAQATSDWILILDGHEVFREGCADRVRAFLDSPKRDEKIEYLEFGLQMCEIEHSQFGYQGRMFKRASGLHFVNQQHNKLTGVNQLTGYRVEDVVIDHLRTEETFKRRADERLEFTLRVMGERLAKNPKDAQAHWYIATIHEVVRDYKKALEHFRILSDLPETTDESGKYERAKIWWRIGVLELELGGFAVPGQYKDTLTEEDERILEIADKAFDEGLQRCPFLSELWCGKGDIAGLRKANRNALMYYRFAAGCDVPTTNIFFCRDFYTYHPFVKQAGIFERTKQWRGAIEMATKAIEAGQMPRTAQANLEAGIEYWSEQLLKEIGRKKTRKDGKPNLLVFDSIGSFTGPLVEHWSKRYNVQVEQEFKSEAVTWADIIWCEWCDNNVMILSNRRLKDVPVICRLHSYEAWNGNPARVIWENIDALVFVSEHVRKLVRECYPISCETVMIPNGIDLEKWPLIGKRNKHNVAFVGHFKELKGIRLLLELARLMRGYTFNLLGTWQDPALQHHVKNYVKQNRIQNMNFYEWTGDVAGWHRAMESGQILSLSTRESFQFTLAEAMAMGIRPVILGWPGAQELYGDLVVNNLSEVRHQLYEDLPSRADLRKQAEKFSLKIQLDLTDALFDQFAIPQTGAPSQLVVAR